VARLVSRIREAQYVAFGWKYPIHAAKRGRAATDASLRSDTADRLLERVRANDSSAIRTGKLIAASGAWCGLAVLPSVVLASALCGLLAALGLAFRGQIMTSTTGIPFGPCIALPFSLLWLHGARADDLIRLLGRV
jgi:prepilin signal peptidase PulO-like enzyme (type II secretory pathway)